MASLTNLPGTAEQILQLFAAQLSLQDVQLPERQYVQPGSMPVWDGEQLTAGLMGLAQGQPGIAHATTFVPEAISFYATFFVLLIREIHVISTEGFTAMEIPTAEQLDADGQMLIGDGGQLVLAASQIHQARVLVANGEGFVIDGLQPLGPEGGMVANRLLLSVSVS